MKIFFNIQGNLAVIKDANIKLIRQQRNQIKITYDSGEQTILEGERLTVLSTATIICNDEAVATQLMRKYYKACKNDDKVFFFAPIHIEENPYKTDAWDKNSETE